MRTVRTKHRFEYQLPETFEEFAENGVTQTILLDYAIRYIVLTANQISGRCAEDGDDFAIDLTNVQTPRRTAAEDAAKIMKHTTPETKALLLEMLTDKGQG